MTASKDDSYLCHCKGVTWGEVRAAVRDDGARSVTDVQGQTTAGTGCQTCHPDIATVLAEERTGKGGFLSRFIKRFFKT
jgi:nitrite reductase (NADH) large subunit